MKRLRYGLIGVGPIGCVVAAHLAQGGAEVVAYSIDSEVTRALRAGPIRVNGALRAEGRIAKVHTELAPLLAEKPDVIILAVKACHNLALLEQIRALGGAGRAVALSCQNGLNTEEAIAEVFGKDRSLRMVMNIGCRFLSGSEIDVKFFLPHVLSIVKGVDSSTIEQIASDLNRVGFQVEAKVDYQLDIFKKAILNSSLGTICSLTGLTMRAAVESPEIEAVIRSLVLEGIELAKASSLNLSSAFTEEAMTYLRDAGDHKPSMALDIEYGRPTENEDHCGALTRLGKRLGVATPVTQAMYFLMKDLERRASKKRES